MRDHLLDTLKRSGKLFADETVAPVLDPGRGRTKRGQLWAYARDDRPWGGSDPPAVACRYAPDRKGEQLGGDVIAWNQGDKTQRLAIDDRALVIVKDLIELRDDESNELIDEFALDVDGAIESVPVGISICRW